jgi:dTDP-4-amino-4,6-dideoxygalactose transaminase
MEWSSRARTAFNPVAAGRQRVTKKGFATGRRYSPEQVISFLMYPYLKNERIEEVSDHLSKIIVS